MFSFDRQKSKLEDHVRENIRRRKWLRPTSPPTFLSDSMGSGLILHVPYILYRKVKKQESKNVAWKQDVARKVRDVTGKEC